MTLRRMMVIGCGALSMMILILLRKNRYPSVSVRKLLIIGIFLSVSGVAGTMLMYYIENGHFGGTSFFGAILFVPVFMLPLIALRIPYGTLMDICAPAGCMIVAVLKLDCLYKGCCSGKTLPAIGGGTFQFPSQFAESATSLAIMFILLYLERRNENRNRLYPFYLILYGMTRSILNWFRADLNHFIWLLPPGNFWSIISMVIGAIWLLLTSHNVFLKKSR